MCGITGIYAFNDNGKQYFSRVENALCTLIRRGPDGYGTYYHNKVAFGHTRLAVLDTTDAASQPFTDPSGRYTIIYNGEFYNFKEFHKNLSQKGVTLKSESDTEIILYLYIHYGKSFIEKINGFFAFAIYDNEEQSLFIARDRVGVKPLYLYKDDDKLIFGSEMKAILAFDVPRQIDETSLLTYLQLNYIPAPYTIFKNICKLNPGSYLYIHNNKVEEKRYYSIPYLKNNPITLSYEVAKKELQKLLHKSVQYRLISDVPLGAFLSGGIDSSIITAVASKYVKNLNTFTIGYKDEPYFDETYYSNLVAKKFKTNHTIFKLSNDDLFENFYDVLDYIDEPFADSSALAVYILSKNTRQHVKVALSGDGADEMFGGYNKHAAHYKALNIGFTGKMAKSLLPLWKQLPQSRNGAFSNYIRKLQRFSEGIKLSHAERYWKWCSFNDQAAAFNLLSLSFNDEEYFKRKAKAIEHVSGNSLNDVLYNDMHLVLQNDMLVKVDMMSMANGLEVRTPFLDYNLLKFAFSIPADYKITNTIRKKILQDTFCDDLPRELYNRPKHGFEVPLLKWFRTQLKQTITEDLLDDSFIIEQNIFNVDAVRAIKTKLFSPSPGDVCSNVWGLLVFQYWWKKYLT